MDLVVHHVLQALVVSWSEEHLRVDLAAGVTIVHDLKTKFRFIICHINELWCCLNSN